VNEKLIIIGAGGHGKVVYDIAESMNIFSKIYFVDDAVLKGSFYKSEVIGTSLDIHKYKNDFNFIIAVGSNSIRTKLQGKLEKSKFEIATLIHDRAIISSKANIGVGTVIMPNVVVNADTRIGSGVILNTSSVIEHDCNIGDFCHISPHATICGTVNVGKHSWIGAGVTVINNLTICDDVIVGAGSVVVRDIYISDSYVGIVK
jgi:acetyltransferase EpsM